MTIEVIKGITGTKATQVMNLLRASRNDLIKNVCKNCGRNAGKNTAALSDKDVTSEYFCNIKEDEALLLKENDEIIGILSYIKCYDKNEDVNNFGLFIHTLIIHPDYRRKGLGTNLMKAFEDIWQSRKVIVTACSRNEELKEFLSKNLYMVVRVCKCAFSDCYGADLYTKYTSEYSESIEE